MLVDYELAVSKLEEVNSKFLEYTERETIELEFMSARFQSENEEYKTYRALKAISYSMQSIEGVCISKSAYINLALHFAQEGNKELCEESFKAFAVSLESMKEHCALMLNASIYLLKEYKILMRKVKKAISDVTKNLFLTEKHFIKIFEGKTKRKSLAKESENLNESIQRLLDFENQIIELSKMKKAKLLSA